MVFISYRRKTGIILAQLISSFLTQKNYEVFLDIDTIRNGKWTDQIERALSDCADYLLLISDPGDLIFTDPQNVWYYKEIELALRYGKNIVIIAPEGLRFDMDLPEAVRPIRDLQVIWHNPLYLNICLHRLTSFLGMPDQVCTDRVENKYDTVRFEAQKRLSDQLLLFEEANNRIFDQILADKTDFNVLDIGCNCGQFADIHFLNRDGCSRVIGIDVSEEIYRRSIISSKFSMYLLDCESDGFLDSLREIMASFQIPHFDLINISFLLLHLKKPEKLLYRIRELLAPDGYLFIRDIDDTQTYAYPDDDGIIQKLTEINNYCRHTGNRTTGGSIYTTLVDCGYTDIRLVPEAFTTAGTTKSQRKRLFYVNYSYIAENIMDMVELYPTVSRYREDHAWCLDIMDDLERRFSQKNFFYKMGTLAFTARYRDD